MGGTGILRYAFVYADLKSVGGQRTAAELAHRCNGRIAGQREVIERCSAAAAECRRRTERPDRVDLEQYGCICVTQTERRSGGQRDIDEKDRTDNHSGIPHCWRCAPLVVVLFTMQAL